MSKKPSEGREGPRSMDTSDPQESRSASVDARGAEDLQMDLSDALFLDTLLCDAVEHYPGHVWLWDECIPANEHYH